MNSTESSFACGNARTRWIRSRRLRMGQQDGFKQSTQTFSRGNFSRSRRSVRNPAAAQNAAQLDPAGPAPTIATSKVSISARCNTSCRVESRDLSLFDKANNKRFLDFRLE